ncbi:cell division protein CrgA [Janibacter melonis]|uniref:cell division protein CrgA n=1 Tax=Janibacter melonis TaxID=262209 RepID=UPI0020445763|nr:cell division protein CrgA [Janibacter melonis]MCM3555628.1 cell division protein CrgA [Janibacter melonis]
MAPSKKNEDELEQTEKVASTSTSAGKRSGDPRRRAEAEADKPVKARREKVKAQKIGNPSWYVPVMLGLMILGLIWVVTFYITQQEYPVAAWGQWNLGAGFALMMAGFVMTTRWK